VGSQPDATRNETLYPGIRSSGGALAVRARSAQRRL